MEQKLLLETIPKHIGLVKQTKLDCLYDNIWYVSYKKDLLT